MLPLNHTTMLPVDGEAIIRLQLRPGVYCVVGDRVLVAEGYVQAVGERTGILQRAVGPKNQLMATNLDRLILVMAVGRALRDGFLMRGMVACALQKIEPVVVINKVDLDEHGDAEETAATWRKLGVRVLLTSAVTGAGMEALKELTQSGVSAMMGFSGVGKSTLINALRPGSNRRTGTLDWQGKGRHITTQAEALVAPGSMLVDLPGVREFGLAGASLESLMVAFPDIQEAMGHCKWPDCTHHEEEGCGIMDAVEAETLDPLRVELWLRMRDSINMGTEGGGRI